jgi:hypothetical protein
MAADSIPGPAVSPDVPLYKNEVNKQVAVDGKRTLVIKAHVIAIQKPKDEIAISLQCHVGDGPRAIDMPAKLSVFSNEPLSHSPFEGGLYAGGGDFVARLCFFMKYDQKHKHEEIQCYILVLNDLLSTEELKQLPNLIELKDNSAQGVVASCVGRKLLLMELLGTIGVDLNQ